MHGVDLLTGQQVEFTTRTAQLAIAGARQRNAENKLYTLKVVAYGTFAALLLVGAAFCKR